MGARGRPRKHPLRRRDLAGPPVLSVGDRPALRHIPDARRKAANLRPDLKVLAARGPPVTMGL